MSQTKTVGARVWTYLCLQVIQPERVRGTLRVRGMGTRSILRLRGAGGPMMGEGWPELESSEQLLMISSGLEAGEVGVLVIDSVARARFLRGRPMGCV